jgi:hypothetical protein
MGESKLKLAKREEMLLSCASVQTMTGRVQVRRETERMATPMGQLAYFIEFLNLTGRRSRGLKGCRLAYSRPNAPTQAEVLGTWLLSMLAGHRRYSHVTARRGDGINPGRLGRRKVISEDALRNALKRIPEAEGTAWWDGHLADSVAPLLDAPWILDTDSPSNRFTGTRKAQSSVTTRGSRDGRRMPITPTSWSACAKCWAWKFARATNTLPSTPSRVC